MQSDRVSFQGEGGFEFTQWHEFVTRIAREVCGPVLIDVITPFGFEILPHDNFRHRRLRRFYCYFGIRQEEAVDTAELEGRFLWGLLNRLFVVDPPMAQQVVVLAARSGRHWLLRASDYTSTPNDILIVAEVRRLCNGDLLEDYAKYLACSVTGVALGSLPEVERLPRRRMARTRIFQLYLLWEAMFWRVFPCTATPSKDRRTVMMLHRSSLQFYYDAHLKEPPDPEEVDAIEFVMQQAPLLRLAIEDAGKAANDLHEIGCRAYHGDVDLTLCIGCGYWQEVALRVRESYLHFGAGSDITLPVG